MYLLASAVGMLMTILMFAGFMLDLFKDIQ